MDGTFDPAVTRGWHIDGEWLAHEHSPRLDATDDNVELARAFLRERWAERAAERGDPPPSDLSGCCKFASLFVKAVFGGSVTGSYDHLYGVVDGVVVDLSAGSADVTGLDDPYARDEAFLDDPDLAYSLSTCLPRVASWTDAFMATVPTDEPGPRL